ncbi:hypothetical protein VTJ83DRAFT_4967 [Remersonia thermophila]|uniref:Folliculin-interacting protein N-terminal domain-containing protein n=1 Tax=Remersonia thermophila TaxID=72144 RepID=A0ABR4DC71_9PEZI
MLGKLFNLGAGAGSGSGSGAVSSPQSSSHRPFPLESVQEDMHTRHLLFPDPQDLYEHRANQLYPLSGGPAFAPAGSPAAAFDYSTDIDLDVRDVRIIIMQDALSSVAASLLYDSQPAPPVATASLDRPSATAGSYSVQEPRRNPAPPRKLSMGYSQRPPPPQPGSPKMRPPPAFDRRPSVHSRSQASAESESQRAWREYREELATFSSCIFGNSELMAYKGTSTKVHVVPSDIRPADSFFGDGRGSLGRSAATRASRLSQSFTSEHPVMFPHAPSFGGPGRASDRKKVLITRLFPVTLPLDEDGASRLPVDPAAPGVPGAQATEDVKARKKFQPRQKRTPMYAVALIITLPPSPAHSAPATLRSGAFRGPGSYAEQDSFPSSFGSARRSGWTLVNHGPGLGACDSLDVGYGSDVEDHIDAITRHWDIIMRTLSHLQSVVASTLFSMLRQVDLASPDPVPSIPLAARGLGRRGEDGQGPVPKLPKTNAKHITLLPNCLLDNHSITAEIDAAKTRIVAGIRASRVATGQNRWPIWREEARWVAKWAGSKEQGFFFYNLLTGFLATHTDWLQALGPPAYRRQHLLQQQQQRGRSEEDALLVPARTVILSDDKIAARRLVFLLSSFLPTSQPLPGARAPRPSTPASFGALSQSPPSFVVPILKEESLRRKINRRTAGARVPSHSRNLSLQTSSGARSGAVPPPLAHLSMDNRHERRASDAASVRTAHVPIRGSDPMARKSSVAAAAATTATVTPETSIPHFSTVYRADMFGPGRPGSSNSAAADDLKRFARDESPGSQGSSTRERRQSSRWSVLSGFWNGRRRDSTGRSPVFSDLHDAPLASPAKSRQPSVAGGARPVLTPEPADIKRSVSPHDTSAAGLADAGPAPTEATVPGERPDSFQKVKRTPALPGAFDAPVKTSVNLDDGVIDVDVPLPDFITSFESAVSSPSSSGYLSASGFGTGLDAFENLFRFATDGDGPLNAAGWLQHYHPDFVLQALPAQKQSSVIDEIKSSMRAEPTPPLSATPSSPGDDAAHATERWVDVSSALVADTTTFTITRIRYRRLVRLRPPSGSGSSPTTSAAVASSAASFMSPSNTPPPRRPLSLDAPLREEFIEEPIVAFDDVVVEAVERVIAAPGMGTVAGTEATVSKASSASSSRSTSKRRGRDNEMDRDRESKAESLSMDPPASGLASASRSTRTSLDAPRPAGFDGDYATSATSTGNHHPDQSHRSAEPTPVRGLGVPSSVMVEYCQQEVPRSQCKTVLLTALEDIIHDVLAGREEEEEEESHRGESGSVGEGDSEPSPREQQQDHRREQDQEERLLKQRQQKQRARERERESPLREAVRGWIEGLDAAVAGVE